MANTDTKSNNETFNKITNFTQYTADEMVSGKFGTDWGNLELDLLTDIQLASVKRQLETIQSHAKIALDRLKSYEEK